MEISNKIHVAIVSSPGVGHLVPVVELAKLLIRRGLSVSLFAVTTRSSAAETRMLESAAKLFDVVEVPPPDLSTLVSPNSAVVTLIAVMMRESRPSLLSAMRSHRCPRPDVLVVDLFGTELLSVAKELGIPRRFVFAAQSAWFVALTVYVPVLDREVVGQYVDQTEPLRIPGCRAVNPRDVVDPMLDRADQEYAEYRRVGGEFRPFDGVLVNTWEDLQSKTLTALNDEALLGPKVTVYPIGPLTRRVPKADQNGGDITDWLDQQPDESVVYVSFGSGGTLSYEQTTELAHGLELSQQRFIWVTRPPIQTSSNAEFFSSGGAGDDPSVYLPEGFLDRTRSAGRVLVKWAPQGEILSHRSVGGFVSHGGWNSALESLTNGVPMVAWPLYAEQRMNADMLAEEFGVAVRARAAPPSEGVVGREEVRRLVCKIMAAGGDPEGREIRARAKKVKENAEAALTEGTGSSYLAMSRFVEELRKSCGA